MRLHRPSPSMLVALLALFVALGGSSYAALQIPRGSVGTKQLKNGAVTSPKVKNNSLLVRDFRQSQRAQLRGPQGPRGLQGPQGPRGAVGPATGPAGGALAGNYPNPRLSPEGRGPAVAGVQVGANGGVLNWFNRRGGKPTATHPEQGSYVVTFPGAVSDIEQAIPVITLANNGEAAVDPLPGDIVVFTWDSVGQPANRMFWLVIFDATAGG